MIVIESRQFSIIFRQTLDTMFSRATMSCNVLAHVTVFLFTPRSWIALPLALQSASESCILTCAVSNFVNFDLCRSEVNVGAETVKVGNLGRPRDTKVNSAQAILDYTEVTLIVPAASE